MATTPGYSGRPLWAKLGIKEGMRVWCFQAPEEFLVWLAGMPDGVALVKDWDKGFGFGVGFVRFRSELEELVELVVERIEADGVLWVAYPKKASKLETDLSFEVVQERILETGLVDIKVCAVSDDYTGLKFMVRKELRKEWCRGG